jgi:hypothetical protein
MRASSHRGDRAARDARLGWPLTTEEVIVGKKTVQLLLCLLHPVAVVLIWYQLAFRREDWAFTRLAWAVAVIFPLVPFVYVLTGNDLF